MPQICEVLLKARDAGVLKPSQEPTAARADIIIRGLATVGITALVDEATGYQFDRARDALAKILEKFVSDELRRWSRQFPDEFYRQICRLRDVDYNDTKRWPPYFGQLTDDVIYKRLAPGVREELRRKNPRSGRYRRHKHHQWLTEDIGNAKLQAHLEKVVAVMQLAPSWDQFIHWLDRVAPRYGDTLVLPLPLLESQIPRSM